MFCGLLVILAGLPSSGKSTIAQALKNFFPSCLPNTSPKIVIIDPDQFRGEDRGQMLFRPEEEPLVKKQLIESVTRNLRAGQIAIVDDLNYYQSMRHDLLHEALQANVAYLVIFINTPVEICKVWNKKRGSKIPDEVIDKISLKFDYFERYAWDQPDFNINPSATDFSQSQFLDRVCGFLKKNIQRRPRLQGAGHIKIIQPNSTHQMLDVRSRKMLSEFLGEKFQHSRKKEFLEIRRDLLKKNPVNLEETEQLLQKFRKTLEIKAKEI